MQDRYPDAAAAGFGYPDAKEGKPTTAEKYKQYFIDVIDRIHGTGSYGSIRTPDAQKPKSSSKKKGASQKMLQKQFPPALASLMSAAAGWAFSDDIVRAGIVKEYLIAKLEMGM